MQSMPKRHNLLLYNHINQSNVGNHTPTALPNSLRVL